MSYGNITCDLSLFDLCPLFEEPGRKTRAKCACIWR